MKHIVMSIIAIFLPWLALLINDNPGGAFVALVMQATVIGWPFAAIWAWRVVNPEQKSNSKN
jgi:multisubunit Na+/H+ antiporter MnhB subunit